MAIARTHWRFGVNDGTESTHTWYAAEDTRPEAADVPLDTTILLRICIQATGAGLNNIDAELQYSADGLTTWNDVTTSSSFVRAVSTGVFTNGQNTTQRLSGTGTFESSSAGCSHDGIAGGNSFDIVTDGNGEVLYSIQILSEDINGALPASNDGRIYFRLTRDGGQTVATSGIGPSLLLQRSVTPAQAATSLAGTLASVGLAFGLGLGSLGVTGHAPSLTFDSPGGQAIDVPAGSLVLKGPARSFTPTTISPDPAALRFMGPQIAGPTAAPQRDDLFLTGHAPDVSATTVIAFAPDQGVLTLTGQTAASGFNGPEIGVLSLTGYEPSTEEEGTLDLPVARGTLTFSSQNITLGFGNLPQPDSLILTGLAPTLQRTYLFVPDAAALVLTGTGSSLAETMPVPAGSLAFTGQAPDGQRTYLSEPSAGALRLSSFPAALLVIGGNDSPIIGIDPVQLVITGRAPNTAVDASVPAGALVLTGPAPSLNFGFTPAAGALTLGSFKPELEVTHPAQAVLTLTGYAPTLAHTIPVGRRALTLTGYAPRLPFRAEPTDQVLTAGARKRLLTANARKRTLMAARRRN